MGKLIDDGADINSQDEKGNTALHRAVGTGQEGAIKTLVERCARKDIKNSTGQDVKDTAEQLPASKKLKIKNKLNENVI